MSLYNIHIVCGSGLSVLENYLLFLLDEQKKGHEFRMSAEPHVEVLLGQHYRRNRKNRQCLGD